MAAKQTKYLGTQIQEMIGKEFVKLLKRELKHFPARLKKQQKVEIARKKLITKKFAPLKKQLEEMHRIENSKKLHPWRLCPLGEYFVESYERRSGPVSGGCRVNPSRKDQI